MTESKKTDIIGIIGAMQPEVETIISRLRDRQSETFSGITFHRGQLGQMQAVVARCGVGKVCAAVCAQTMVLHYGVAAIINTGVGGGIDPSLDIGDVVVATALVQHDVDTTALGDPPGLISELNKVEMKADTALSDKAARLAEEMGIHTLRGVIASGDGFVSGKAQKERLHRQFGAVACEMEGGAVAQVCEMNGLPLCVLRAISDKANEQSVSDYPAFVQQAAAKMAAVVCGLFGA